MINFLKELWNILSYFLEDSDLFEWKRKNEIFLSISSQHFNLFSKFQTSFFTLVDTKSSINLTSDSIELIPVISRLSWLHTKYIALIGKLECNLWNAFGLHLMSIVYKRKEIGI